MILRKTHLLSACVVTLSMGGWVAAGDEPPPKPQPKTTADPAISLDDLGTMLVPLTKEDLQVEAAGWIGLVKTKAQEISDAEISARNLGRNPPAAGEEKPADAAAASKQRDELMQKAAKLREERTRLIDRANLVLSEMTAKGGKNADYELYLKAVAGLKIDIKDTGAAWSMVVNWLKSSEGGLRWVKNILLFIGTLIVFRVIAGLVAQAVRKALAMSRAGSELFRNFMVNTTRKLVSILGIIVALSMLEIDITPFLAAIGAVGFIVAFAVQGTLSNLAAGIMILLYRPFDLGNTVTVAGVTGKVESMSLVSTSINTPENKLVLIPNSAVWGAPIHQHR